MARKKKGKKLNHRVLREGEHTGHRHVVTTESVTLYDIGDGILSAVMPEPSRVVHEEHNKLFLPAGDKLSAGVREYDHWLEESREVVD